MIVTDQRTHAFLEAFTRALGIELVQADEDGLLKALEAELAGLSTDGGAGDMADEDTVELAAGLLTELDDAALLGLSQDIWESLGTVLKEGNAPPEVRRRFAELDEKRRRR